MHWGSSSAAACSTARCRRRIPQHDGAPRQRVATFGTPLPALSSRAGQAMFVSSVEARRATRPTHPQCSPPSTSPRGPRRFYSTTSFFQLGSTHVRVATAEPLGTRPQCARNHRCSRMLKRHRITFGLLVTVVIMAVLLPIDRRQAAPLRLTFRGYTNAPVGSRVALFGVTNISSLKLTRWSGGAIERRGSPLTERWLGPPVTLPPGTGECLQVPAPATGVPWRIILLSSDGWKDQWNRLMVRLRFGPGLREERTFSDWIEE